MKKQEGEKNGSGGGGGVGDRGWKNSGNRFHSFLKNLIE